MVWFGHAVHTWSHGLVSSPVKWACCVNELCFIPWASLSISPFPISATLTFPHAAVNIFILIIACSAFQLVPVNCTKLAWEEKFADHLVKPLHFLKSRNQAPENEVIFPRCHCFFWQKLYPDLLTQHCTLHSPLAQNILNHWAFSADEIW